MSSSNNNKKITVAILGVKVKSLEKAVDCMDKKIDLMMTNHIPHLEIAINSLETKVGVFTALNIGAIIIGLIVSKML